MGAGPIEVAIVAEEIGRVLAPEPFIETVVLAGGLVAAVGTAEQKGEILGGIAEGTTIAVFAHAEPGTRWTPDGARASPPRRAATAGRSPASRSRCPAAPAPTCSWSRAAVDGGTGLFLVQGDAAGLTRTGYRTHDGTRAANVRFEGTPAVALGARRRPDRGDRAGAGRGPDRLRPRGDRRHGHRAADDDGVPQDAQAVRRHPQQVPGADLPGGGHVRVPGAGPQHRAVGVDGAGGRRRRRPGRRPRAAAGQPREPAHRQGGHPAARRDRRDGGVLGRALHQPAHRDRPPARRRRLGAGAGSPRTWRATRRSTRWARPYSR